MSVATNEAYWKNNQGYQENPMPDTCGNCKYLSEDKKMCMFGDFPVIETATCEMWGSAQGGD